MHAELWDYDIIGEWIYYFMGEINEIAIFSEIYNNEKHNN